MSQLAALLARLLELPVLDQTEVTGNYNIRLEYVPEASTASSVPAGGDASGLNLFHALEEQAGLKLQPKRAGVEQLIVDRIEKLPTAN